MKLSYCVSTWKAYLIQGLQVVKCLPTVWETQVWSLCRRDPLEKEMATHSSTPAWKSPWKEEPGSLQSMGSQKVGHNWVTKLSLSFLKKKKNKKKQRNLVIILFLPSNEWALLNCVGPVMAVESLLVGSKVEVLLT